MKKVIGVVFLGLIVYVIWQAVNIYKAKSGLEGVVAQQLSEVDDNNQDTVKRKLVDEAGKLGITLASDDIHITYEDTDIRSVAQQFTAGIATFINKRVEVRFSYTARLAGIPLRQEVANSMVKHIEVRARMRPEMQQLLEATPQ